MGLSVVCGTCISIEYVMVMVCDYLRRICDGYGMVLPVQIFKDLVLITCKMFDTGGLVRTCVLNFRMLGYNYCG